MICDKIAKQVLKELVKLNFYHNLKVSYDKIRIEITVTDVIFCGRYFDELIRISKTHKLSYYFDLIGNCFCIH